MPDDEDLMAAGNYAGGLGGPRRFAADEMVACEACVRANPPTRMNCLYCGARLPADERNAGLLRPTLRPLEEWEAGYNIVLLARAGSDLRPDAAGAAAEAADLLRLEPERFEAFLAAGVALPVARAASLEEAELIERRLAALGFAVMTAADEELKAGEPPRRPRAFESGGEYFFALDGAEAESQSVKWADVTLLVAGRIVSKRIEVEERQGALRGRGEVVEARELSADEAVLDVYAGEGGAPLRVLAGKFDYTCLGGRKGLVAGENFLTLVRVLREHAPSARFDDSYMRVRPLLAAAWPPAERTESGGLRRSRPGRLNTEAVTVTSNEAQFTRYSRLRRLLALKGLADSS